MKVLIIGSTGVTGKLITERFLHLPSVKKVTSISRRSLEYSHPKLNEIIHPKMNLEHIENISDSADHYICCLGSTIKQAGSRKNFTFVDKDMVVSFGKNALKNQAKSFHVISAMGSNPNSMFFYNRVKGEMEDSLKALGLNSLYIYRPSLLVSDRKEFRPAEKVAISALRLMSPLLPKKTKKKMGTKVTDLAKAIVNNVLSDERVQLKIIKAMDI